MDNIPLYVKIGSILGIATAAVTLILNTQKLWSTIRSFGIGLYKSILKWEVAFSYWRLWNQYHPSCEITKFGDLEITQVQNNFYYDHQLRLDIEVRFTNNDCRYSTPIEDSSVILSVLNKGKGRDKAPYYLRRISQTVIESPSGEESIRGLPSGKSMVVRYTLGGDVLGKPLLNDVTFCKVISTGEACVEGTHTFNKLKAMPSKFLVKVIRK